MSDDTTFSVDVLDEVLEKELAGWKEQNEGFMVLDEGNFDPKIDLQELEKLLEEGEYNEAIKETEEATRRGMTSRSRRSQPVTCDFPWYSFPRNVPPETHACWTVKLDLLKKRKVHVPAEVDWHWIGNSGLMEAIEPYLDKVFNGVHGQFMCLGWRRIFEIQEVVYKELVYEFLATVSFAKKDRIYADDNLTFCLGGERRSLSIADFALQVGIYLPAEVHTPLYQ
ncbi:unnamed protein product [Lactuca virosa]|uniref:Uncharacterized protein n=1 Tax=Lactuca virosa TaxID=75947 RepID=A0AAU9NV26_9ASTR|nr:unnamed protein product [Lactuca virosa]